MLSKNLILGLGASTLTYAIDVQSKDSVFDEPVEVLLAQIKADAATDAKAVATATKKFLNFASTYNKTYLSAEETEERLATFTANSDKVDRMNVE